MSRIAPCLWFDGRAEEAAGFYTSLLPESRIDRVMPSPAGMAEGAALVVEFTLAGQRFIALNGGPQFPFTEAVSFAITCATQGEVDRLWERLTDGGSPGRCGWLKDRFGVSWQVVPEALVAVLNDPDRERAGRAMQAMMGMGKISIDGLHAARDGVPAA